MTTKVTQKWLRIRPFVTWWTNEVYTLTVPKYTAYVEWDSFFVSFHVNCLATPTININGLGARTFTWIDAWDLTTWRVYIVSIGASNVTVVWWVGWGWIVFGTVPTTWNKVVFSVWVGWDTIEESSLNYDPMSDTFTFTWSNIVYDTVDFTYEWAINNTYTTNTIVTHTWWTHNYLSTSNVTYEWPINVTQINQFLWSDSFTWDWVTDTRWPLPWWVVWSTVSLFNETIWLPLVEWVDYTIDPVTWVITFTPVISNGQVVNGTVVFEDSIWDVNINTRFVKEAFVWDWVETDFTLSNIPNWQTEWSLFVFVNWVYQIWWSYTFNAWTNTIEFWDAPADWVAIEVRYNVVTTNVSVANNIALIKKWVSPTMNSDTLVVNDSDCLTTSVIQRTAQTAPAWFIETIPANWSFTINSSATETGLVFNYVLIN